MMRYFEVMKINIKEAENCDIHTYMILLKDICTEQSLNVYDFIKGYMYGTIS